MNPNNLTRLHQFIVNHYDLEELRTLCFGLGVDYDSLGGEGKAAKARELLLYLGRRGEFDQLLDAVNRARQVEFDTRPEALAALYEGLPSFEFADLPTPPATKERKKLFLVVGAIAALVCVVLVIAAGKSILAPKPTADSAAALLASITTPPAVTPTPLAAATAQPDEVLVLVAEFKGEASYDPTTRIFSRLFSDLENSAIPNTRVEQVPDVLTTPQEAQTLGRLYGATLVIWGTYDELGIWPHYEVVHGQHLVSTKVELAEVANLPSEPDRFALYITREMGAQLSYLSLFTLGQMAYFGGEYDRALALFDEALSLRPEATSIELSEATLYFFRGYIYQVFRQDLESAIIEYGRGLQFEPDSSALLFNRGLCHTQLGQYQNAIQDFDHAIRQDASFVEAYFNRANAYRALEDYQAALVDFDKAIDLKPDDLGALYGRGFVHLLLQNNDKAVDDFDRIISLEPTHVDAHYGRGFAYVELGEYDQAIADYNQVIDLDPQNARAYNELAWLYADILETNLDKAIELAEKAVELAEEQSLDDVSLASFLDTLGWAYYKQGDIEIARAKLLRAIDLQPEQEIFREHLRTVEELQ